MRRPALVPPPARRQVLDINSPQSIKQWDHGMQLHPQPAPPAQACRPPAGVHLTPLARQVQMNQCVERFMERVHNMDTCVADLGVLSQGYPDMHGCDGDQLQSFCAQLSRAVTVEDAVEMCTQVRAATQSWITSLKRRSE